MSIINKFRNDNKYYDTCTTTLKSRYMYHNNEKYMYTHMHVYSVPVVLEQVSLFSLCLRVAADGTRFLQKMGGYVNSLSGITELLERLVHTTYM